MTATRHLHQLVGAERLLVEPGGVAEVPRSIERIVRIFGRQPLGIDPEILEQSRRNRPIRPRTADQHRAAVDQQRSEEHTSELQSLMRISYAVFCLKTKQYTPN